MQNGFVESFNDLLRDECLNEHLYRNLNEPRQQIVTLVVHGQRFSPPPP